MKNRSEPIFCLRSVAALVLGGTAMALVGGAFCLDAMTWWGRALFAISVTAFTGFAPRIGKYIAS